MRTRLFCTAVALCLTLSSRVNASIFTFTQSGFDDGAFVAGTFDAEDLDHDGEISSFDGEVFDFMATFSGNSLVAGFVMDFAGLGYLVYNLDGIIGNGIPGNPATDPGEGLGWLGADFAYAAGAGALGTPPCDTTFVCGEVSDFPNLGRDGSTQLVSVSVSVPEPSIVLLLLSGLLMRIGSSKRPGASSRNRVWGRGAASDSTS